MGQESKDITNIKEQEVGVTVVFTEDDYIKELNERFRKEGEVTDVLAFSLGETDQEGVFFLGEVVVNLDQAKRQAKEFGVEEKEEIARLITHGTLHLLGYEDENEEEQKEMEQVQERVISRELS